MTGAACGAGNAYPSGAPDFTSGFYGGSPCFLFVSYNKTRSNKMKRDIDKIEEVCQNQAFLTKLVEIGKQDKIRQFRHNWTGLETWIFQK